MVDEDERASFGACLKCFINNNSDGSTYYIDGYGKCYYLSNKGEDVDCDSAIGGKVNNKFLN